MESEQDYNQERKNLLKIVVDTGDDYSKFDNSSQDHLSHLSIPHQIIWCRWGINKF